MGKPQRVIDFKPRRPLPYPLPSGLKRSRPREYSEWRALRSWGKLPEWELLPPGYLLRESREKAGLSQIELARRLGCTQQAIAQAERWQSNPTVQFMRAWCEALGADLALEIRP